MQIINQSYLSHRAWRTLGTLFLLVSAFISAKAQLSFAGSDYKVLQEKVDASSGLNSLYVVFDTRGVTATYKATTDRAVTVSKFANLGGGYAEDIPITRDGRNYSFALTSDDLGYIIQEGTDRQYYWVVNYANHHAEFRSLEIAPDQECDRARLTFTGNASKITYFSINGAARELSRDIVVEYNTLTYKEKDMAFYQVAASQSFSSIDQTIGVFAPLCDTYFTLTGDRFLKQWGMARSIESPSYRAVAVEAHSYAEQELREVENEQVVETQGLGGSAPVTISFKAVVSDAAIFREWQLSHDPEFETIIDRFNQLEFDYTFRSNGNNYIRFVANNSAATCEYVGETFEVFIGESGLLCPNAFSPNGDGVNDEWRVSYRSIIDFECHIFNRWGQEVFATTNPAVGWDGRHRGKYVPSGVYYYVVRARGADGKKYRLDGDINIVKANRSSAGSSDEE